MFIVHIIIKRGTSEAVYNLETDEEVFRLLQAMCCHTVYTITHFTLSHLEIKKKFFLKPMKC